MVEKLIRVLYVEDEPDIQTVAKLALEAVGGFVVEICSSGEEALVRAPEFDPQGADQVRENANPVTVFISPPTPEELERRLRKRGTETPEDIDSRLANAESEMAAASRYRYLIINDELEQAVRDLQAIVVAERRRQNTAQVKRSVLKD